MKKIGIVVCAAAVAAVAAAGCSGGDKNAPSPAQTAGAGSAFNQTGYPVVNEKITLKMMGPKAAIHGPWDKMDLFTEMEKLTNIHFEFDTPAAETFAEKKNLTFAGNELPDVFFGGPLTPKDEVTYGKQGLLIPLETLIDKYAPNLKRILEQKPEVRSAITAPDGHIYALPQVNDVPGDLTTKMWINKQWIANVGLKMPSTVDELYTVLKAFKEKDPNGNKKADEMPLTSIRIADVRPAILAAYGLLGTNAVNETDGSMAYYPTQPGYKEYLAFMRKLYAEGLLDNESFTQTTQQLNAKGKDNILGAFVGAAAFTVVPEERNAEYELLPPLTSAVNSKAVWPKASNVIRGLFAITSANKHPEATIRWIDHLYSDEGSVLVIFGKEGEGYKWLDAGKTRWERTWPEGMNPEEYRGGKVTPAAGVQVPTIRKLDFLSKRANDQIIGPIAEQVDAKYVKVWKEAFPLVYFSEEQQKRVNVLEADLNTYVEQMEAKFITGKEPLDNWDKYVDTIKKMGLDEYLKIHQDAYAAWKKNSK
ncbi:extracellular solute-binding protein [Paenibacillus contaminans]|uniref:ABC transporter substrate-binding protein n=1 Tax=Paenibacillus contaminans TaxID=450362 RepID=A0A329M7Y3_9BACL|nr:extracellular solute-binding protein [Paenibacillus contaminans]RAV16065.1 ABC transporter substrate-binding protein [Paenibacillus contaminans]